MVRKIILGLVAVVSLCPSMGCILNRYDSDPNKRLRKLLNDSEDLRQAQLEIERFWFTQPSTMTYERVNGAVGP